MVARQGQYKTRCRVKGHWPNSAGICQSCGTKLLTFVARNRSLLFDEWADMGFTVIETYKDEMVYDTRTSTVSQSKGDIPIMARYDENPLAESVSLTTLMGKELDLKVIGKEDVTNAQTGQVYEQVNLAVVIHNDDQTTEEVQAFVSSRSIIRKLREWVGKHGANEPMEGVIIFQRPSNKGGQPWYDLCGVGQYDKIMSEIAENSPIYAQAPSTPLGNIPF